MTPLPWQKTGAGDSRGTRLAARRWATMRNLDFTDLHSLLSTLIGLVLVTLLGVGIRLLTMMTFQQRRERQNRQINERLKALIAAYKTLGGSFTGDLTVSPSHKRDVTRAAAAEAGAIDLGAEARAGGSDRARRIRDAVEAALSDVVLFGTQAHIRLAERALDELVAGRPIHVHELVRALRDFVRDALDLDPIPPDVTLPPQGPARPGGAGGKREGGDGGSRGGGGGGGAMAGDAGFGLGSALGGAHRTAENHEVGDDASPHRVG